MDRLFIIGAGGLGREVFSWLKQSPAWNTAWKFSGFLDDNPAALSGRRIPAEVVGGWADFARRPSDQFVCAIGDPQTRLKIGRELRARGALFPTVQHPTSIVGEDCHFGAGCILCPGAVISTNVVLGDFVLVNVYATVGHDARIADGVTLSGHTDITGAVVLGEGVFVGAHAAILPRAEVGAGAKIGAGSVVLRKVAAGATVMGVPAKQILP